MKNHKVCQKCWYLILLNSQNLLGWKDRNLDTRVRIVDIQGKNIINIELQLSAVLYGCESWTEGNENSAK
jgi:hypothetical protein